MSLIHQRSLRGSRRTDHVCVMRAHQPWLVFPHESLSWPSVQYNTDPMHAHPDVQSIFEPNPRVS